MRINDSNKSVIHKWLTATRANIEGFRQGEKTASEDMSVAGSFYAVDGVEYTKSDG